MNVWCMCVFLYGLKSSSLLPDVPSVSLGGRIFTLVWIISKCLPPYHHPSSRFFLPFHLFFPFFPVVTSFFFFFTFLTFQNNRYILYADTVPPYFWFPDILPPIRPPDTPHSNTTSIFTLSFLNSFSFQFSYFCDRYLINFFNFFQLHLIFRIFFILHYLHHAFQ